MKDEREEKDGACTAEDRSRRDLLANLTVFDPENPPFETQCVCVYLRELEDEEIHPDGQTVCLEPD